MRMIPSRWLLAALLIGWAVSHATVFGQDNAASPVDKLRQGLDKSITVDYAGQTLNDVINHLRDKTGLAINVDQNELNGIGINPDDNNGAPILVKANNEKAGQVLRKILNKLSLSYVMLDGEVLVTSVEIAGAKQLLARVSIDLDAVPLKKAVREFAKNHGLNVVLDPKVSKQTEVPVSLQLENASIETTLRLLAEMADLKAVRMGTVIFVTSEERAKKIREEELHQLDSPLNLNSPGGTPLGGTPLLRGGMGGGLGGAAPAIRVGPVPPFPPPAVVPAPIPAPGIRE